MVKNENFPLGKISHPSTLPPSYLHPFPAVGGRLATEQRRWGRRVSRRRSPARILRRRSPRPDAAVQATPPFRRSSAWDPEYRGGRRNPTGSSAEPQGSGGAERRREPLRRGVVSARLPVPDHIPRPPYVGTAAIPDVCPDRQVHDGESIMRMLDACELAARVLQYAGTLVKLAVTTDEIDRAVHQMIIDAGAYPSLGYGGFPKSVCTSVNECTCHGIPDSRQLQDGDIINIDVTVYLNGYHGDTSRTYLCGDVDESTKQLVKVSEECMMRGISACRHGASFKEIGQIISELAGKYGYSVDPFVGHGIGRIFHCEPIIWSTYDYEPGFMVAGQTFTIEPTLSMGSTQCALWDDGWTAVAVDGSLSAQFEHTVLVTREGVEILTGCP